MMSVCLWKPKLGADCQLLRFMHFLEANCRRYSLADDTKFNSDYEALYQWSIRHINEFWMAVFNFCQIAHSKAAIQAIDSTFCITDRPVWFKGCHLSYAENLLKGGCENDPAIYAFSETSPCVFQLSFGDLNDQVNAFASGLLCLGVCPGDRVVGLLPNNFEAVVCYLATNYIGAIWSSTSLDFGAQGIIQRFGQVRPKVLFTVLDSIYRGKRFSMRDKLTQVCDALRPDLVKVIIIPFLEIIESDSFSTNNVHLANNLANRMRCVSGGEYLTRRAEVQSKPQASFKDLPENCMSLYDFLRASKEKSDEYPTPVYPVQLPFNHPLVIMYSSGTTGTPKCLVHSTGGTLLKHICEQKLNCDFVKGDCIFYLTNTGWMMWNWLVSALALGASIVVYEGCPFSMDVWKLVDCLGVTSFGTSSKWLAVTEDRGRQPGRDYSLTRLRSVLATGSVLAPRSFDYVYKSIKSDVILGSISGGTDMIGCCVGCCPLRPVYRGQIQCRLLGMAVESWDSEGKPCRDQMGELVITKPFPTMPLSFWGDVDQRKYTEAYFSKFPNVWCHADFIEIHSDTMGLTIGGRSDTTLNPSGIRFGSDELYNVGAGDKTDGCRNGDPVPGPLADLILSSIRSQLTPRFLPALLLTVSAIPYTVNGKKVELSVRRLFEGEPPVTAFCKDSLVDPSVIDVYTELRDKVANW